MAKKKKQDVKTVLKNFKELGGDTLSRLATTVKVDVPAVAPAIQAAVPNLLQRPASTMQRLLGLAPEQKAARKLKRIKRAMAPDLQGQPSRPKRRRSRLPLFVAVLAALLCGGGYKLYHAISLPDLHIVSYLDYHRWLDTVSGNATSDHVATKRDGVGRRQSVASSRRDGGTRKLAHKRGVTPAADQMLRKQPPKFVRAKPVPAHRIVAASPTAAAKLTNTKRHTQAHVSKSLSKARVGTSKNGNKAVAKTGVARKIQGRDAARAGKSQVIAKQARMAGKSAGKHKDLAKLERQKRSHGGKAQPASYSSKRDRHRQLGK